MMILSILRLLTSIAGLVITCVATRYLRRRIDRINEHVYSTMMLVMATMSLICFALLSLNLYELSFEATSPIPNLA